MVACVPVSVKVSSMLCWNTWVSMEENEKCRIFIHMLRLPPEAPSQRALHEALIPVKRHPGRPKTTWVSSINKDLQDIDPTLKLGEQKVQGIAEDRLNWRKLIKRKA